MPSGCELWSVQLADRDGRFVVAVNTDGAAAQNVTVEWSDLGLASNASLSVRDVWRHADLGPSMGNLTVEVAPKSCVAVRLSRAQA